jgi:hypothetical protein
MARVREAFFAGGVGSCAVRVPKVSYPWFEEVRMADLEAARVISTQTGRPVAVDH